MESIDARIDPPATSEGICHGCDIPKIVGRSIEALEQAAEEEGLLGLWDRDATEKRLEDWYRSMFENAPCEDCLDQGDV